MRAFSRILSFAVIVFALAVAVEAAGARIVKEGKAAVAAHNNLKVHSKDDQPKPWDYNPADLAEVTHAAGLAGGRSAYALRNGAPLPRPRSIIRCPPGGCNETFWQEYEALKHAKRQIVAPSPLPTTLPAQSQNYQLSCTNIVWTLTASTPKLSAQCYDQTGTLQSTSIIVDNCIANNYGSMECSLPYNLFWAQTCRTCRLSGQIMTCSCNNGRGSYYSTTLDVSQCFGNKNGALYCTNHKA